MTEKKEIGLLRDICKKAEEDGRITGVHLAKLLKVFGPRFTRAWETLKEGRVKKYIFKPSGRVIWIVVGKEREYLVMSAADFCTCNDFYFRVMEREVHLCYHLIAQKLSEGLGWYDLVEEEDELHDNLMEEWKKISS
jgi:predicted nucleic acid-binding Zn finger protein